MQTINNRNTTQLLECLTSETLTVPRAAKEVGHQELSLTAWGMQNGAVLWKILWWFPTKLKIFLPYDQAVMLLELKT